MPPTRAELLQGFIAQRPQDPFPKYALALELKNGGELARAWEMFQALLAGHPEYTATYLHAGNTLLALGRRDEARDVYTRGITVCGRVGDAHARGELETALAAVAG
jgi:tetratricopeptide (TPR) repeat protein